MTISRRRFMFGSAVAVAMGGALTYSRFIEPSMLSLEQVRVHLSGEILKRSIRILHLTDLHYSSVVPLTFLEKAFDLGMRASPDVVCLTGDYVTANDLLAIDRLKPLLASVGRTLPVFASLGNHDGGSWSAMMGGFTSQDAMTAMLEDAHVHVLRNSTAIAEISSQRLRLVGLEDLWSGSPDPVSAFSTAHSNDLPTIVLTHNPDSKELLAQNEWHLALCGHTHGGQVVLPFIGAPVVPIRDRAFTAGLNEWRGRKIYTSRGVGNLYGIRFNCPPEVSLVELKPGG